MSNTIARYQPAFQPAAQRTEISQATAIEQSRAVAEVQASVYVAQANPRNRVLAIEEMRESTSQQSVADKAFWRFPRGGKAVTGVSIHLARELARCWGNVTYGVSELRRDDKRGESEMQAYAWDLQTNARNAITFIVPHKRDLEGGGLRELVSMRDIYENNANAGARRVREAILAVLPSWFIDDAIDRCNATLRDGGGVPLPKRIANCIEWFSGIGVDLAQLEAKLGKPSAQWDVHEVTQLGVTFKSIERGEIAKADEFPQARVTAADLTGAAQGAAAPAIDIKTAPAAEQPAEPEETTEPPADEPAAEPPPAPEAEEQAQPDPAPAHADAVKKLTAALNKAGIKNVQERRAFLSARTGKSKPDDLTVDELLTTVAFIENGEPA